MPPVHPAGAVDPLRPRVLAGRRTRQLRPGDAWDKIGPGSAPPIPAVPTDWALTVTVAWDLTRTP